MSFSALYPRPNCKHSKIMHSSLWCHPCCNPSTVYYCTRESQVLPWAAGSSRMARIRGADSIIYLDYALLAQPSSCEWKTSAST